MNNSIFPRIGILGKLSDLLNINTGHGPPIVTSFLKCKGRRAMSMSCHCLMRYCLMERHLSLIPPACEILSQNAKRYHMSQIPHCLHDFCPALFIHEMFCTTCRKDQSWERPDLLRINQSRRVNLMLNK